MEDRNQVGCVGANRSAKKCLAWLDTLVPASTFLQVSLLYSMRCPLLSVYFFHKAQETVFHQNGLSRIDVCNPYFCFPGDFGQVAGHL